MSSRALRGRPAPAPLPPPAPAPAALPAPRRGGDGNGDRRTSTLTSRIPRVLKLPLLILVSLNASALLYELAARCLGTDGDLVGFARSVRGAGSWDGLVMAGALVGWRIFEIAVGWWEGYDAFDLAALTLLSHAPPLYLLSAFYKVRPTTVLSSLVIDVVSVFIPLNLLRPASQLRSTSPSTVANREIIADSSVQILTTLLAASIYGTVLYFAYAFGLPVYLVTYFTDIPSVAAAHTSAPITLIALLLPLGLAAKSFIFTPAVATAPSSADIRNAAFDPAAATLGQTFWYNVWGYKSRTKTAIRRTGTLVLFSGVNTFLRTWLPLAGVEAVGAATYAAVWVVAGLVAGVGLGTVAAV